MPSNIGVQQQQELLVLMVSTAANGYFRTVVHASGRYRAQQLKKHSMQCSLFWISKCRNCMRDCKCSCLHRNFNSIQHQCSLLIQRCFLSFPFSCDATWPHCDMEIAKMKIKNEKQLQLARTHTLPCLLFETQCSDNYKWRKFGVSIKSVGP